MRDQQRDVVLKQLYDAFAFVEKPDPLTTYDGSYWDRGVDVFNSLDWENATYSDFAEGGEGAIICPALTKVYLLPRLFKMLLLRRSGRSDDAVDNLSIELESWPVDPDVEALLSEGQKQAIVAAWSYLDSKIFYRGGSHTAREMAKHWALDPH
jgi:hypothetical protein